MALLSVRDLSKAYDGLEAVCGVGFDVEAGEILGLLGPNGAGKTTTIESIIGLVEPDSGSILIAGIDARLEARRARQKIGVALQSTGLHEKVTPREAIRLFGAFYPAPIPPEQLLDRFGLSAKADAKFDTLSGGQRQRLALALAFVNNPDIIFLDEPTVGLDPQMRLELHDHIQEMKRQGCAILLATHDMEEAEQLCDRIAVINGGRVVAQGSPRQLIAGFGSQVRVRVQTSASLRPEWAQHLAYVRDLACESGGLSFTTDDLTGSLEELARSVRKQGAEITSVVASRATLEEVIIDLTRSGRSK